MSCTNLWIIFRLITKTDHCDELSTDIQAIMMNGGTLKQEFEFYEIFRYFQSQNFKIEKYLNIFNKFLVKTFRDLSG